MAGRSLEEEEVSGYTKRYFFLYGCVRARDGSRDPGVGAANDGRLSWWRNEKILILNHHIRRR